MSSEKMKFDFIPLPTCARRRVSERNHRKAAALNVETATELCEASY